MYTLNPTFSILWAWCLSHLLSSVRISRQRHSIGLTCEEVKRISRKMSCQSTVLFLVTITWWWRIGLQEGFLCVSPNFGIQRLAPDSWLKQNGLWIGVWLLPGKSKARGRNGSPGSERKLLLCCPASGEVGAFSKDHEEERVSGLLGLFQQACLKGQGDCFWRGSGNGRSWASRWPPAGERVSSHSHYLVWRCNHPGPGKGGGGREQQGALKTSPRKESLLPSAVPRVLETTQQ